MTEFKCSCDNQNCGRTVFLEAGIITYKVHLDDIPEDEVRTYFLKDLTLFYNRYHFNYGLELPGDIIVLNKDDGRTLLLEMFIELYVVPQSLPQDGFWIA